MRLRLDASVLVSLFCTDGHTPLARAIIPDGGWSTLAVGESGGAEVAAAIARPARTRDLTAAEARAVLAARDDRVGVVCDRAVITSSGDVARATASIRRPDHAPRAPDAVPPALADRLGAKPATFDRGMATATEALSIPAVPP